MKQIKIRRGLSSLALGLLMAFALSAAAAALGSQENPQSGSTGLQGTISSAPPTRGATIGLPVNGQTFTSTTIAVSGACPTGLLVKMFSNNIFIGSVQCENGTFNLRVDLFSGQNDLIARVYDALDQAGPDSNTVRVNFQDAQFTQLGPQLTLTSNFAKRGADPGSELTWPLILGGGSGPYAISVDWGDGSGASPKSVPFAGNFDVSHVYKNAGIYNVTVKASDANGNAAFLQLVAVANGKVTQSTAGSKSGGSTIIKKQLIVWPYLILLPLAILAFWLGRRYELLALHRKIEQQTSFYKDNR